MERNLSGQSSPPSAPLLIPGGVGETFNFGTYDVHWKIDKSQTGRRFSVIHQLVAPRALVAPLQRHHREDEYSYVLTGTFGALLGDAVVTAEPGTWVFKPRGQWHTFWNAGDIPCEIIEVISPAGFEDFSANSGQFGLIEASQRSFCANMSSIWTSTVSPLSARVLV